MTRLVCATHGHCFDGLASAAVLTELAFAIRPPQSVEYVACGYAPGQGAPGLDGDENALLDYRYEPTEDLAYYFDHHATAFRSPEDQAHFESQRKQNPDYFLWDPTAVSCAGMLARHAEATFGLSLDGHEELLRWADKIDGARFDSAEQATDRKKPYMRLAAVVERFGDSRFLTAAVPILRSEGLSALCQARFVKDHYRTLAPKFKEYERRVRERGALDGRVTFIDLTEKPVTVVAKFSQYRQYPQAVYSVILASMGGGWKISAGFNPWNGSSLDVNIGEICSRYGGGGHPVVGAVSFGPDDAGRAQQVAQEIALELQTPAHS